MDLTGLRLAVLGAISWPAPPPGYGPWEQIAFNVADGMRRRGLDVTLFATGNSRFDGKLASVVPVGLNEDSAVSYTHLDVYKRQARNNEWIGERSEPFAEYGAGGLPRNGVDYLSLIHI